RSQWARRGRLGWRRPWAAPPLSRAGSALRWERCAARRRRKGRSLPLFFPATDGKTEGLELAIKVGALQARALCYAGHAAVLLREQVLEVEPIESLPRLAIRPVHRDLRRYRRGRPRLKHALHVVQPDLLRQGRKREILHHVLELGEVARPRMVAQGVEGSDRQAARRAALGLHELREHQGGEVGHVLRDLPQRG